ncbi:uncharacterized protein CC84DRAFT_441914 [Paraphaeosphaeria sporulosa]|uniref:Uncharacterized protein n=1 Tax=Paraphaeosphaeria sporulosa TaxID=1460663 RepID=A0A177CQM2_9PLEO|nr:uncharacterized protein CC84DRAFT_441914 [Paraphaeosphaeria sporulosa]OAG09606.1 hypothetical protein CC84DRAFT_441914 [Paraphaeosphaeria sporulosa]
MSREAEAGLLNPEYTTLRSGLYLVYGKRVYYQAAVQIVCLYTTALRMEVVTLLPSQPYPETVQHVLRYSGPQPRLIWRDVSSLIISLFRPPSVIYRETQFRICHSFSPSNFLCHSLSEQMTQNISARYIAIPLVSKAAWFDVTVDGAALQKKKESLLSDYTRR